MDLEVTQIGDDVTCARLNGRLDSPGVDRVELRFSAAVVAPARDAVVDLSGVSFLASMGIRLLITSARALSLKGRKVALYGAPQLVQEVLENAALDQIIPIFATQEQALASLRA